MKWRPEEDHYLLKHYESASDLKSISDHLDRTETACRNRLYRIRDTRQASEEKNETLPLEHQWFLARSSNGELGSLPDLPKGAISSARLSSWSGRKSRGTGNAYQHTKTGYRADIGINARSGWEANFARVLKSYGIPFEFEPAVFTFPVKRGNKSYKPDFFLPGNQSEWIEIKGYFDKNSMIKMRRFKKYYPDEWSTLTMIISKSSKASREFCAQHEVPNVLFYQDIAKIYKDRIKGWEG